VGSTAHAVSRGAVRLRYTEWMSVTTAITGTRQRRNPEEAPLQKKGSHWLLGIIGFAVLVCMGVGGAVLARNWPYAEAQVLPGIQDTFKSTVTVKTYRRFYFPHPGCEMEMVKLRSPSEVAGHPPLATAQKVRITGRYSDLLYRPYHVAEIEVDGLHVRTPSQTETKKWNEGTQGANSKVSVGTVITNGAVLEVEKPGTEETLKFEIHKLEVDSVAAGRPIRYAVSMYIPEPPGELESTGTFGPWHDDAIGKIPLSGNVKLNGARLDKYSGLGGTIHSEGRFGGTLEQVEVTGEASAPDFELKSAGHKVELRTQFDVLVNAIKGEAQLKGVVASVGKTIAHARGAVTEDPKQDQREAEVDFSITNGRAEDLLWVFSSASQPAMFGPAIFSGHVRIRKFGDGFLDALQGNGKFEVKNGHFQSATQAKINQFSARASGKKIKAGDETPEAAVENLSGDVKVAGGVARMSMVYFQIPGARARVEGTYKLDSSVVDLHGNLWTNASLSDNTTGIKELLLEPLDPIFRRKHAGAMLEVSMTGDIHDPSIGTALTKRKAPWGKRGK
jgi:AsmA-like C-terminal region